MSIFLTKADPAPLSSEKFSEEFNSWLSVLVDTLNETLTSIQNFLNNMKISSTSNIGGSGAGPISVSVTGLVVGSPIVATIASSSNPVWVISCIATSTGFDVTFSGDPGASCILNYVAGIVAQ